MIQKLYNWYGKTPVRILGIILVLLLAVAGVKLFSSEESSEFATAEVPTVKVASASSLATESAVEIIGSVEAVNEAHVQSETGGRVIRVNADIGDRVSAGAILVQLENAAEQATVLQAEGSYDAAVAAAAQSDINVSETEVNVTATKNKAINAYRSAFNTVNNTIINTVDDILRNGDSRVSSPSLLIDGRQYTQDIIKERTAFRKILDDWRATSNTLTTESNLDEALTEAESYTNRANNVLAMYLEIVPRAEATELFTAAQISAYQNELTTADSNLSATLQSLDTAETDLATAREALNRTKVSGTNADISAANAQVKQALGVLRSAQASLAKTIIRAPIAGEINSIDVNPGDFLPAFTEVAVIANNQALEITAFVGEQDLEMIKAGQTVMINNDIAGTVTTIAPAVDPVTKKTQIKIATDSTALANGDTVIITLTTTQQADDNTDNSKETVVLVPLAAVKFSANDGSIFTVENGMLIEHSVTLGQVRGGYIEIIDGIDNNTIIVTDARGLTAGETVEAITQN